MISFCSFLQDSSSIDVQTTVNPETYSKLEEAVFNCPDLNLDTIKRLWGRQWFSNLVRVQFLVSFILHYVTDEGIVFISQKDPRLVRQYRHKTTVRNMILQLIKLGVLYDLQTHYSYGSKSVAKYYYANQISLISLVSYYHSECKNRGVKPDAITFQNCSSTDNTVLEPIRLEPLRSFRGFNSRMSIDMTNHSMEQIETKLYEIYPIQYYQEIAHTLNEDIPLEEHIIFQTKYKIINGKRKASQRPCITKISIRATNSICYKKSRKKQTKISNKDGESCDRVSNNDYREDYLARVLGEGRDEEDEFDVKASVPRVAHATHFPNDGMGNLHEDIYETIFYPCLEQLMSIAPSVHNWKEGREIFKLLTLELFFCCSPKEILRYFIHKQKKILRKNPDTRFEVDFLGPDKALLLEYITCWKKVVDDYCGVYGPHSTEVFFDESCIYLEVRGILQERGIRVVQVYDCFYFRHGEKPDDMEEIIAEAYRRYRAVCREHAEK